MEYINNGMVKGSVILTESHYCQVSLQRARPVYKVVNSLKNHGYIASSFADLIELSRSFPGTVFVRTLDGRSL